MWEGKVSLDSLRSLPFIAPSDPRALSAAELNKQYRSEFPLAGAGPGCGAPVPRDGITFGPTETEVRELGRWFSSRTTTSAGSTHPGVVGDLKGKFIA